MNESKSDWLKQYAEEAHKQAIALALATERMDKLRAENSEQSKEQHDD